jgi:Protein of unknown function (DUF3891)
MLLRSEAPSVLAIPQQSHAWISGQLARAWGNDRFPAPEPWEEVCLAAEQHDIGMACWDRDPAFNPETGLPYSFLEMPLEVHLGLWDAAPQRVMVQSRFAALLVSMHGARLYGRRNLEQLAPEQADAVRSYLERQRAFQRDLTEALSNDPVSRPWVGDQALQRNSQLVWTWDFLSLAVCLDWAGRTARDVPTLRAAVDIEIEGGPRARTLALDPWPFRTRAICVRCDGWRLAGRLGSAGELAAALARPAGEVIQFEFLPRRG